MKLGKALLVGGVRYARKVRVFLMKVKEVGAFHSSGEIRLAGRIWEICFLWFYLLSKWNTR